MYPIYRLSTRPFQFQIYDARNKLRDECGFGQHQLFAHEFTNYLISLAVENLANQSLTKTITTCLLLIARFNILKLNIEGLKVLSCPMIVSFTSDCKFSVVRQSLFKFGRTDCAIFSMFHTKILS